MRLLLLAFLTAAVLSSALQIEKKAQQPWSGIPPRPPTGANVTRDKAHIPPLTQQRRVRPLISALSTQRMLATIEHLSSYHTRYYLSSEGQQVTQWLYDHLVSIIQDSPLGSYISLTWHRHSAFPQSSLIARFEPTSENASLPTTIIGAHLDSINKNSPSARAPGADDDASGTAAILEVFRVLASRGYVPGRGPVEFHWYAAEEPGELGSADVAAHAREVGQRVGGMIMLDTLAYISRKAPEHIAIFRDDADTELNGWLWGLVREYGSIEPQWADVPGHSGSDHQSWTDQGYPACGITGGDPMGGGKFPGYMNPHVHTPLDRVDLDDEDGFFSIDTTMQLLITLCLALLALASPLLDSTSSLQEAFSTSVDDSLDPKIEWAIATFPDPVDAVLAVHPHLEAFMATPRLLHVDNTTTWMTEGDKVRLRKARKAFVDFTDVGVPPPAPQRMKAHTPPIKHQDIVRPLLSTISTQLMGMLVSQFTTIFPNRYYEGIHGEQSAHFLHRHLSNMFSSVIPTRPPHVSLMWHTHRFPQSSIIARFEAPILNASAPLTIIAAHQDSINWESPLLRAPGATDDASGTFSIFEAFRVLYQHGFVPERGPVEFHWYAGEEGGLLGSQDRARYVKDSLQQVGAMIQFDMTSWVSKVPGVEEHIGIIGTETDQDLNAWVLDLAEEYVSVPARLHYVPPGRASDHFSWYNLGYPAACADTQDGRYAKSFPPIHTAEDRMNLDREDGYFSVDHMARFTELAIAFAIEQAGWGKYPEPQAGL